MAEHGLEFQGGELTAFRRKIGEKGWFGLNWPREYGGLGLTAMHQHLLMSEFEYCRRARPRPHGDLGGADDHAARHRTEQDGIPAAESRRGEIICARRLFRARTPVPTWPACAPGPCATATSG